MADAKGLAVKVLITGYQGFIGRNLVSALPKSVEVLGYDVDSDPDRLDTYAADAEFVFHLAGVNRPLDHADFMRGNYDLTATLLDSLERHGNSCPILLSSSTQAELPNPYGESKLAGEEIVFAYGERTGAEVYVYRFPNIFGKWARPNYNSAIATFCYNISRGIPITVNDPNAMISLVYIDDLVDELLRALAGTPTPSASRYCVVPAIHSVSLQHIVDLLTEFRNSRQTLSIPDQNDRFAKDLYATYLSYLPTDDFAYNLLPNRDKRGSFSEILHTSHSGQISVNVSHPNVTKGNHWHRTKLEKFLVVSGTGVIRFRQVHTADVIEYRVSGDDLRIVDIPPGYVHNIENMGPDDLITIIWASENFDPDKPDTIPETV